MSITAKLIPLQQSKQTSICQKMIQLPHGNVAFQDLIFNLVCYVAACLEIATDKLSYGMVV